MNYEDLREAFAAIDADGTGELSIPDLRNLMNAMGQSATQAELLDTMKEVDLDGSGLIDFDEFFALMSASLTDRSPADEIAYALAAFDTNAAHFSKAPSGMCTAEQLRRTFQAIGFSQKEITEICSWVPATAEGLVNYEEFSQILHRNDAFAKSPGFFQRAFVFADSSNRVLSPEGPRLELDPEEIPNISI